MENVPSTLENTPAQNNNRTWWLVAGAGVLLLCCCLVAVLVIAAVTMLGPVTGRTFSTINPSIETSATALPAATSQSSSSSSATANAQGNPNAPVKIVEYADFQCPYCANFWRDTEPKLFANYVSTGKVYFVFRSVGAWIGPESERAAEAAYCAGDQGKFWEYHDALFAHQGPENSGAFADDKLTGFASSLALNMEQFGNCLRSNKYGSRVSQDATDAKVAGVQGTPSFMINGKQLLEGAQPYDAFATAIDAILGGQ